MKKNEIVIIADYSSESPMTLDELIEASRVSPDFIRNLIDYGILYQHTGTPADWEFTITHLQRVKTAERLQRDLEVNLAGVAVVLDLLDEMDELQAKINLLEKHLKW
jgi:chaperone modulatory protein CbpM